MLTYKQYILSEMKIVRDSNVESDDTDYYIIAYKDLIYKVNDGISKTLLKSMKSHIPKKLYEPIVMNKDDIYDISSAIQDLQNLEIFVGKVEDGELNYNEDDYSLSPESSVMIKKIVKTLKLKGVNTQDRGGETGYTSKYEIKGEIPNTFYHGTSGKYIKDILRLGLRPNRVQSNWIDQNIIHENTIFFTSKRSVANGHANMTGTKTKNIPIVIRFKVPNKDLIIPDYDIDNLGSKSNYEDVRARVKNVEDSKDHYKTSYALTKEAGIYGYNGSIMPINIDKVYVNKQYFYNPNKLYDDNADWEEYDIDEFKSIFDRYEEMDMWVNDYDWELMKDEWEEEEED